MAKTITLNRRLIERMLRQYFDTDDSLYAHTSILNDARFFHGKAEEAREYAYELNDRKQRKEQQMALYRESLIQSLIDAKDDTAFERQLEQLYPYSPSQRRGAPSR